MSEDNWKRMDQKFLELKQAIISSQPQKQNGSGKKEEHNSLIEMMECPNCSPPEKYRELHYKLMGQKECKQGECHNVDRTGEEYCSECGEPYGN